MNLNSNITKEELRARVPAPFKLVISSSNMASKAELEKRENLTLKNVGGFNHSVSQTCSDFLARFQTFIHLLGCYTQLETL